MNKHVVFLLLISALAIFFYWLWSLYAAPTRKVAKHAPWDSPFVLARKRLIAALLGDFKAADRLILHEKEKFNCSWLDAVQRAIDSLEHDRTRG